MLAFLESLTGEVPEWAGRAPHLPPAGSEGLPETQPLEDSVEAFVERPWC